MDESILIVVHPGSLLGDKRIKEWENLYGSYEEYLDKVRDAVNYQKSIVISPLRNKVIPFKIPKEAMMIKDFVKQEFYLGGGETLLPILRAEKINNVKICGEELWWYSNEERKSSLYLGCVVFYHNLLYKSGTSSRIIRALCYPSKDPPDFRGSF
jgi:hypothetical protein